jgi:hypothetical protein
MSDKELVERLLDFDKVTVGDAREAALRIEALTAEVGELQEVFDFQWRANMRAVEMWRAANPGNDLVLPDSARLTVWMLDRIEALTAKNEMLGREVNIARYGQPDFAWSVHVQVMDDLNAKLDKAVELLKEARQDLEEYVTHEWPKDEHPVYERKWERDMELCRRIDATLAEIEGEKT